MTIPNNSFFPITRMLWRPSGEREKIFEIDALDWGEWVQLVCVYTKSSLGEIKMWVN